jgi:O2-independent ubiquinone biosynthesis protein UbiV
MPDSGLSLGPVLFNWQPEVWRDFYYRIADEAAVDTVYIGEVVCAKRTPFFEPVFPAVLDRLRSAGKTIVFSTLAEVMVERERKLTELTCRFEDVQVEANDASSLYHLRGIAHRVGPFVNTYNEATLALLAARGAVHVTAPPELPRDSLVVLADRAAELGVALEVAVFGRVPLALSARCYHARAHGRTKDNCRFVCEEDPDGMALDTLQDEPFLVINGIQTMSHGCLNLIHELPEMQRMGIAAFRLSPHSGDMVAVADAFRAVLRHDLSPSEAMAGLGGSEWSRQARGSGPGIPFCNGFYHGRPGHQWVVAGKPA